jgi:uncharacterized protein YodC (DUF2158 family)
MNRLASTSTHRIAIAAVLALAAGTVSQTAFAGSSVNATTGAASAQSRKAHDLRPGDKVRLNSGSPLMTVDSVQGDRANVQWATEYGEFFTATVPIASLTVVGGPGWLPAYNEP